MNKLLFFILSVLLFIVLPIHLHSQIQLGSDIDGEGSGANCGVDVALSATGEYLIAGSYFNSSRYTYAGAIRVFRFNGSSWIKRGSTIYGERSADQFGTGVAISEDGSVIAGGAIGNDASGTNAGHVRVFQWSGSNWVQLGSDINGEASGDLSGYRVALNEDGTILAIGAIGNSVRGTNTGHVRVYRWNGSSWVKRGSDIDGENREDEFGCAVSLSSSGNVIAIGAYLNDGNGTNSGHVRVYYWNGTNWVKRGADLDGENAHDAFGTSVSLSSDGLTLAAGGYTNDANGQAAGHVRVFQWNGQAWVQKGTDIDGENAEDRFGSAVSLSENGNILAVGAQLLDGNGKDSGGAYIFNWNGTNWVQSGNTMSGEASNDWAGWAVSLSKTGERIAVGAYKNDGRGTDAGHVRVYELESQLNAAFSSTGKIGCAPLSIEFEDASSGNPISWSWEFPGGSPSSSTIRNPFVTYNTPGTYDVKLTVRNNSGESATIDQKGYVVAEGIPEAAFLYQKDKLNITFQDDSRFATQYNWDFGDGYTVNGTAGFSIPAGTNGGRTTGTYDNPVHRYNEDGTYVVILSVTGGCGTDVFSDVVQVVSGITADFISNEREGCVPLTVEFYDNSSDNVTSWEWSFPGGVPETSNDPNPTVIYDKPGNYNVSLRVLNSMYSDVLDRNNYILVDDVPEPLFSVQSNGLEIIISDVSLYADRYKWDFGDGYIIEGSKSQPIPSGTNGGKTSGTYDTPIHRYEREGTYSIKLTVSNACGEESIEKTQRIVYTNVNNELVDNLQIFPNPSDGVVFIRSEALSGPNELITVFSQLGKKVITTYGNGFQGNNLIEIDLTSLEPGIYYVKISGRNTSSIGKIVIE